ncbi:MAG: 4-alpha-glucanotransferase, partial [Treponema sp.]|nr:4-alpha-glucanotransferase [Treponema sp.]
MNKRKSGILLHVTSLPGTPGIGTLGESAYKFADWLKNANQSYWQVLP